MKPYANTENIEKKADIWLNKIQNFNQHPMKLNVNACVLIVVDMQNFFLDPVSPTFTCGGLAILPGIKNLIEKFRKAGRPVIFTRHVHHPDNLDAGIMGWWWQGKCIEGEYESEIHSDLKPLSNEKVILKHRYSAFYNTDLETVLRCLKIEDIVIAGIMTNMCCESTARDAYYRDYRVIIPADGTGSINEEMHIASLLNLAFGFAHISKIETIADQLNTKT